MPGPVPVGWQRSFVTPQNWLFLTTYPRMRQELLNEQSWNLIARLGTNAFRDMNWWAATTCLIIMTACKPDSAWQLHGFDVSDVKDQDAKASRLANREPTSGQALRQEEQLKNPDCIIKLESEVQTAYLG